MTKENHEDNSDIKKRFTDWLGPVTFWQKGRKFIAAI